MVLICFSIILEQRRGSIPQCEGSWQVLCVVCVQQDTRFGHQALQIRSFASARNRAWRTTADWVVCSSLWSEELHEMAPVLLTWWPSCLILHLRVRDIYVSLSVIWAILMEKWGRHHNNYLENEVEKSKWLSPGRSRQIQKPVFPMTYERSYESYERTPTFRT